MRRLPFGTRQANLLRARKTAHFSKAEARNQVRICDESGGRLRGAGEEQISLPAKAGDIPVAHGTGSLLASNLLLHKNILNS